jgi:hypothetical protein
MRDLYVSYTLGWVTLGLFIMSLPNTGLCEGLEHLKIETKIIKERVLSLGGYSKQIHTDSHRTIG